jgi:hypothetical protein
MAFSSGYYPQSAGDLQLLNWPIAAKAGIIGRGVLPHPPSAMGFLKRLLPEKTARHMIRGFYKLDR